MIKPNVLVVYYSRSGTTRKIAVALAKALHCDIEAIVDTRNRSGFLGYLRSLMEALEQRFIPIVATKHDASAYDLVIVGTPVWASTMSTPIRAYLATQKSRLPEVAFFCTLGGRGADRTLAQMEQLAGKAPRARCAITMRDVQSDNYVGRLAEFIKALRPMPARDSQVGQAAVQLV